MMNNEFDPKAIAKTIDVEELYDLDITIARFILPRLMVFKEHCERTPNLTMTREEWVQILDKMIWNNEQDLADLKRDAKASLKPISEGLSLYHKYYRSLWW